MNPIQLLKELAARGLSALLAVALLTGCDSSSVTADFGEPGPIDFGPIVTADFDASESFDYDVPTGGSRRMRLENVNGFVTVRGDAGAESVAVSGERTAYSDNSLEDAASQLEAVQVRFHEADGVLMIRTEQPDPSGGRSYQVDYEIVVPASWNVAVAQSNGSVGLVDLEGSVDVGIANGNIDYRSSVPQDGGVDLSTVNGNITLEVDGSTSADLDARVTFGRIRTINIDVRNPSASPRSLTGQLGTGEGAITLLTVNGDITVVGR